MCRSSGSASAASGTAVYQSLHTRRLLALRMPAPAVAVRDNIPGNPQLRPQPPR